MQAAALLAQPDEFVLAAFMLPAQVLAQQSRGGGRRPVTLRARASPSRPPAPA
ncbi:hypothetical protein LMG28614_06626 [Paraburkholderia ultramafica]|uniref:Uncharacterized protein n=1 Tax=Paraburkholderia ultramafica TaxID=1544867 RepID=A0A6S7BXV1_9BURK|nr:hypothetical protein LMG28614_06626 [Paraburkholderia ultramafica]